MNSDTLVILIHGFCRGAEDMQFWKKSLSSEYPNIITPDLPTTFSSFEKCLDVLSQNIAAAEPEKYKQLYFAGHSMGGLLARAYLQKFQPGNAARLVCAGTPHRGSRLADIALMVPGTGRIWQPLNALKTSARENIVTPDIPGLEIGVIIGMNNAHWPGKLFLSNNADGLVESFSAHADDAKSVAYTQLPHDPMQYDLKIAQLIKEFFRSGEFPVAYQTV